MSRDNMQVVRRMFERESASDFEGWPQCWGADAEWISEQRFKALEGRAKT
jgi:ketosteroid isomerase-like protein